jgi:tetratricopeptide (TPR) repeat protein
MGDYERAAALFGQAADVRPEDYQARVLQSNMYESIGDLTRARETAKVAVDAARRAFELNPADSRAMILGAGAQLTLGNRETALEWADRAYRTDPKSGGVAYNSACLLARLGDTDRALDLLERAIELGARNKKYFETDTDFASIRQHPRFKALLERI